MSDLGAIFHVKKAGVQYDAHAYTTLDECPEPNLKVMYKGQQAYVKLGAKGEGGIPCYVKDKAGKTYQVKKEGVPTGSCQLTKYQTYTLVVPAGVKVIEVERYDDTYEQFDNRYIGVTPDSTHTLYWRDAGDERGIKCRGHNIMWDTSLICTGTLRWSPEINKRHPDIRDYN